jgi:hypothetical protein
MANEINPLEVAYVERDNDYGAFFMYLESDVNDRRIEPFAKGITAKIYSKLRSTYGIPTIDEYREGKRKDRKKIEGLLEDKAPPPPSPPKQPQQMHTTGFVQQHGAILHKGIKINNKSTIKVAPIEEVLDSKICPCGHIMKREDYPGLSDHNWSSKIYCSKECRKTHRI